MIATTIANLGRYRGISVALDAAFDWIASGTWKDLEAGRHEIDGDRVFALASSYVTKSETEVRYEAHRKYIDIQMLAEGREFNVVRDVAGLSVESPYVAEKDIEFLADANMPDGTAPSSTHLYAPLFRGAVVVLFPEDAHKPCVSTADGPEQVKKVVIKVATGL